MKTRRRSQSIILAWDLRLARQYLWEERAMFILSIVGRALSYLGSSSSNNGMYGAACKVNSNRVLIDDGHDHCDGFMNADEDGF